MRQSSGKKYQSNHRFFFKYEWEKLGLLREIVIVTL